MNSKNTYENVFCIVMIQQIGNYKSIQLVLIIKMEIQEQLKIN